MNRSVAASAFACAMAVMAAAPAFGGGYQGALARSGSAAAAVAHPNPAPVARPNAVTRPSPPFRRAPGPIFGHRHPHHGSTIVFFEPPFFWTRPLGYFSSTYPYSSTFYSFGAPPPYVSPPPMLTDPFYCWVDEIGFSDEGRFVHHLHEVHGVPLEEALESAELVGGRYVFFGY